MVNKRLGLYRQELGSRSVGGGCCQVSGSNCPSLSNQDLCKCTGVVGAVTGTRIRWRLAESKEKKKMVDGVVDDEEVFRLEK